MQPSSLCDDSRPPSTQIFREFGDEPESHVVAQAILEWRGTGVRRRKILSTLELRFVIDNAITCTFHAPLVLIIIACSNTLRPHHTAHAVARGKQDVPRTAANSTKNDYKGFWRKDKRARWNSRTRREKEVGRGNSKQPYASVSMSALLTASSPPPLSPPSCAAWHRASQSTLPSLPGASKPFAWLSTQSATTSRSSSPTCLTTSPLVADLVCSSTTATVVAPPAHAEKRLMLACVHVSAFTQCRLPSTLWRTPQSWR